MADKRAGRKINNKNPKCFNNKPLAFNSADELMEYANYFFDWCEENDKRPTLSRLAFYLDIDRKTLLRYESCSQDINYLKRLSEEEKEAYCRSIKKIKVRIEAEYEDLLYQRDTVSGGKFTLSNNYGWSDKKEIVQLDKSSLENIKDEELEQRLKEYNE